eukprot:CAMPEP_0113653120 /NCGR_PEP_ID=MMETSP0017_2-20120614/28396_1 /TAXON_ID=2856 /ORGANISM="Cylindrotheca closterium" /LENGTH=52 /DNA_ID=CAMNT_0000566065 /DNA_START=162 /DNA_END=320 /DNA_ORIENTATION=+ /assembly_acc=CAM_ASM_000147
MENIDFIEQLASASCEQHIIEKVTLSPATEDFLRCFQEDEVVVLIDLETERR